MTTEEYKPIVQHVCEHTYGNFGHKLNKSWRILRCEAAYYQIPGWQRMKKAELRDKLHTIYSMERIREMEAIILQGITHIANKEE